MGAPLRLSVAVARTERLDRFLADQLALSRTQAARLVGEQAVRVNGEVARASRVLARGDVLEVAVPEPAPRRPLRPAAIALTVVWEDEHLALIDKPAGLVVHPGAGQPDRTLLNALLAHAPALSGVPRAGIVHRLDKDTSGLLVVAKTVTAQNELVKQLAARTMRRLYLAVVQGDPPASGVIDAPVGRDVRARTRMAVTHRGKPARTAYRVLERYGSAALVECRLETGRTHQIRVHFQHIRHPLIGDVTYRRGTRHGISFPRQALHATELSLVHPKTQKPVSWRSPLPRDMKRLVESLRNDDPA